MWIIPISREQALRKTSRSIWAEWSGLEGRYGFYFVEVLFIFRNVRIPRGGIGALVFRQHRSPSLPFINVFTKKCIQSKAVKFSDRSLNIKSVLLQKNYWIVPAFLVWRLLYYLGHRVQLPVKLQTLCFLNIVSCILTLYIPWKRNYFSAELRWYNSAQSSCFHHW